MVPGQAGDNAWHWAVHAQRPMACKKGPCHHQSCKPETTEETKSLIARPEPEKWQQLPRGKPNILRTPFLEVNRGKHWGGKACLTESGLFIRLCYFTSTTLQKNFSWPFVQYQNFYSWKYNQSLYSIQKVILIYHLWSLVSGVSNSFSQGATSVLRLPSKDWM